MKTNFFSFAKLFFVILSITATAQNSNEPINFDSAFFHKFKWKSTNAKRNDSIKIFSLSPIHRRVGTVNGLALGGGHYENYKIRFQKVNGMNIEASPVSLALMTFCLNVPFEGLVVGINDNIISNAAFLDDVTPTYIKISGLNISSGGFMGGAEVSGVNVCVFSSVNKMSGFSITGALLSSKEFYGVSIAGIANLTEKGNGAQIGISNVSRNHKGVQIGLFNNSRNLRGVQFGLWNSNGKRRLPLLNWQFRKEI